MVIALHVVQFCSEIMLVISNRTLAAHSSDFKITCMISDQIYSTYPFSLIAGFHCHAIKNKNNTINSRIWEMKWGWYGKTLAKIQVSVIFHTRHIVRNCSPKLASKTYVPNGEERGETDVFAGYTQINRAHSMNAWAPTLTPETNRNICHWVLLNSSLKELINIKAVPFLIKWLFK